MRLLRPDKSVLAMTEEAPMKSGQLQKSGLCEIGNNGLTQGDATVITGYLPVGKNLETAAFQ